MDWTLLLLQRTVKIQALSRSICLFLECFSWQIVAGLLFSCCGLCLYFKINIQRPSAVSWLKGNYSCIRAIAFYHTLFVFSFKRERRGERGGGDGYPEIITQWIELFGKRHLHRLIRLTQCCMQFKSLVVKVLCVLYLHDNVAFTFKWRGYTWNKMFYSPKDLNWVQHWVSQISLLLLNCLERSFWTLSFHFPFFSLGTFMWRSTGTFKVGVRYSHIIILNVLVSMSLF